MSGILFKPDRGAFSFACGDQSTNVPVSINGMVLQAVVEPKMRGKTTAADGFPTSDRVDKAGKQA